MGSNSSSDRSIKSAQNQQAIYDALLLEPMYKEDLLAKFDFKPKQLIVYLRNMERTRCIKRDTTISRNPKFMANPNKPFKIKPRVQAFIDARIARQQSLEIKLEDTPKPFVQQVNAYTRIIKLLDKAPLNATMPKKKLDCSRLVSMGSGLSMFKNWE